MRAGMELERLTRMTVGGFDYSTLTPEVARQARDAAEVIRPKMLRAGVEVGRHLLTMKEVLPHGTFGDWCRKELGIASETARNYMNTARWLEGKTPTLGDLPLSVIYKVAAPNASAEVVQEVVAAAEAGLMPKPEVILQKLVAARAEERAVKQELAKKPGRTEADARKSIARKQEARARKREKQDQEAARANGEREARRARQHAVAQRLVAANREVVAAVVEAAEGDIYGLMAALEAALDGAETRP